MGFPGGSNGKEPACNGETQVASPREANGNPLQYSSPEIPMDRGVWHTTVHGVTKSQA